ncbi:hypothetical protein BDV34DRAFT_216374 [Aspergillus parasiticus]|uniref:LysM domain-containing protein n=1 Tax=Aspergillus parasiticus TaxID=5067 RepID=A0A5N6D7V2_ASPPA|nr:hypothetical protein BDV34DRAFT_216374 [Aspergillus parasiticus]
MASTFLSLSLLCGFTLAQRFLSHPNRTGIDSPSIDIPDSLSSVCGSPLNETVQCNVGLAAIAFNGHLPSAEELGVICTPQCLLSLQALHNQQVAACTDSDVVVSEGITYPPTFSTAQTSRLMAHNTRSGQFCAPQIDSCCFLNTLQTELNSFFGNDEETADIFSSLTSSCSVTQYAITSPPSYTIGDATSSITSAAPVTPTNGCVEKYVVQAGDTCNSISIAKNISTHGLLYSNGLPAYCALFAVAGSSLCIPEPCDIYTVQRNDTCYSIAQAQDFSFSVTQLIAWNPNINRACSNLDQLVSSQICISWPRGAVSAPAGTPATTPALVPTDIANGTNTRCAIYYRVSPGIGLPDFYFLNPGVNPTRCNNLIAGESYCVRAVGDISTDCIRSGSIAASWTWADCDGYEVYVIPEVNSTRNSIMNTCHYIAWYAGVSLEQILTWNPSLSYNISNPTACFLEKGNRYCVIPPGTLTNHTTTPTSASTVTTTATGTEGTIPTPTQSGMTKSCNAFYYVQPDDGLNFYKWNPAIGDDCKGLQPDYYVCVGVDSDVSSVTATPTSTGSAAVTPTPVQPGIPTKSTGSAVSTPTPTQAGMTGSCGSFYYVKTDDGCWDIAHDYSIELQDFYSWNPVVGDNCQGLQANVYVCVGLLA